MLREFVQERLEGIPEGMGLNLGGFHIDRFGAFYYIKLNDKPYACYHREDMLNLVDTVCRTPRK